MIIVLIGYNINVNGQTTIKFLENDVNGEIELKLAEKISIKPQEIQRSRSVTKYYELKIKFSKTMKFELYFPQQYSIGYVKTLFSNNEDYILLKNNKILRVEHKNSNPKNTLIMLFKEVQKNNEVYIVELVFHGKLKNSEIESLEKIFDTFIKSKVKIY